MKKNQGKDFTVETTIDPKKIPKRIAFIKKGTSAHVNRESGDEKLIMTYPGVILRGIIVCEIVIIILALISLFFNAPLEGVANPEHTPNPAKAPWYFLGLQELLHYFPPVVAGVLLPVLVLIALIVIPYFNINIKRENLWTNNAKNTFVKLTTVVVLMSVIWIYFHAYAILVPTLIIYGLALMPSIKLSLAEWIMTWFVFVVVVLTIIGVFFRGQYWQWIWPWIEGIY